MYGSAAYEPEPISVFVAADAAAGTRMLSITTSAAAFIILIVCRFLSGVMAG
jgi:hypothetical protein